MSLYKTNEVGETVKAYTNATVTYIPVEGEYERLYDDLLSLGWFDVRVEDVLVEAALCAVNAHRGYWIKEHVGMDPLKAEVMRDCVRRVGDLFARYGIFDAGVQWRDIRLDGVSDFVLFGEMIKREYHGCAYSRST
jgi:hypothetical protein